MNLPVSHFLGKGTFQKDLTNHMDYQEYLHGASYMTNSSILPPVVN